MQPSNLAGAMSPERDRPGLLGLLVIGLVVSALSLSSTQAVAQRSDGTLGVGLQVGTPGGATAKIYRSGGIAYDAVFTTDADDFVRLHLHRLWEQPVPDSPLHYYLGPGLVLGGDQLSQSPVARLGISTEAGLNFYDEQFEVFLHVTPSLRFFPTAGARLGGSVGLRYYFP